MFSVANIFYDLKKTNKTLFRQKKKAMWLSYCNQIKENNNFTSKTSRTTVFKNQK